MPNFSETQTLSALTGARFFAAALVVCYHFGKTAPLATSGYAAVGFFFLLSGFVLAYSYIAPDGRMRGNAVKFWAARAARIYPAYLLAFAIAAPFNIANSTHVNGGALATAKLLLGGTAVLSLVQAWTPWTAWYWNYPAWSLSAEAFFYLMFPLLVPLAGRLSRRRCLLLLPAIWLCALAVPALFTYVHGPRPEPIYGSAQLAIEVNPLLRFPEFVMGVLLGRIFALGKTASGRWPAWVGLAGIAGAMSVLACGNLIPRPLIANGLAAPFSAMAIFGLAHGIGPVARLLSLRPLVLLGEASYGIYIFQVPVSLLCGLDNVPAEPWRLGLFACGLIMLSVSFFKFVEQPFRPALRARFAMVLEGVHQPAAQRESVMRGVA